MRITWSKKRCRFHKSMNHERRGLKVHGYVFLLAEISKEKLTLSRASHADENHYSLFWTCPFFFKSFLKTFRSHLMILKCTLAMLLCSVTREISLKKRVSRGEVAGLSPRKLETVWTLFKLVNLVPIVSVSNKNLNFAMLIIFYAINPLGLIIHCLYFSCVDTFFNQLYVGTSDRILRTVFAVVNRKKRADCGKSLFATYGDKIQPSKVDIPEHSGSSSRVLCQTTEDRPRLSVEVPGRENRSLWQEKEGDRKEAK